MGWAAQLLVISRAHKAKKQPQGPLPSKSVCPSTSEVVSGTEGMNPIIFRISCFEDSKGTGERRESRKVTWKELSRHVQFNYDFLLRQ